MKKSYKWIIFFVCFFIIFLLIRPIYVFSINTLKINPIKLIVSSNTIEKYNDQVNILLLGIAGGNHDGPNLSDSIMVANYNFKTNKLTTISLPRDIWSDTLNDKINSAYAYGEAKEPGVGGFILAKAEISAIIGQPIQYAAVMDFDKFKELIDYLGGIEVDVEKSFVDNKFPIAGRENDECGGDPKYSCRYETISFQKGLIKMSGDTALKFVRSRYSEGSEGTDFSREERLQKIFIAVKNKIINIIKTLNINKYQELYSLLDRLIRRDLTNQQSGVIVKNVLLRKKISLEKIVLNDNLFINPPISDEYDQMWVLIPKDSLSSIHKYVRCQLDKTNCK